MRIRILLIAVMVSMLALSGCGQGGTSASLSPAVQTPMGTPTPSPTPEPSPTPVPVLTVRGLFPGEQPRALPVVLEVLNERLGTDAAANLALAWAAMDGYDEAAAAAVASGSVDFLWCDSAKLRDYAGKSLLAPLDGFLEEHGKPITDAIDSALIGTMRIGGSLMGIPSAGGTPLADTADVLVYREDLRQEYGLPELDSVAAIEQYLAAVSKHDPELTPVSAPNAAFAILKAFGPEGVLPGTGNAVAYRINGDGTVTCMPLQDAPSFQGAIAHVRSWYKAGWLSKDAVAVKDASALTSGAAASAGGSALSAAQLQPAASKNVSEAVLAEAPVFNAEKYYDSDGGSALCLAAGGNNPETAVKVWAWAYSGQDNYDLLCYGIEHVHFEIADGGLVALDGGYSAFPAWIFGNSKLRRYAPGISEESAGIWLRWNEGARISPLLGFTFDPDPVKDELIKTKAMYNLYGPALATGSADTKPLLAEFAARMKAAGQEKIVAEAQAQIDAFLTAAE